MMYRENYIPFYLRDKREILTKEYYQLLKDGKNFKIKNGIILELETDYTSNINWEDDITIYSCKEKGVIIQNNLSCACSISEDFYNDFINHCKDIEIVYNEIKSFKDNQVEHFEDYLQNFEEELQEQIPINTITIIVCSNKEYNFTIVDSLYSMELNTQIYKALNVIENIYKNVTSKEFKETLFIEDDFHVFYEHKITLKHTPKNYKFEV